MKQVKKLMEWQRRKEDTVYLSLGHDSEWQVKGNNRVQICTRCGAVGSTEPLRPLSTPTVSVPEKEQYTPAGDFIFGNICDDYFIRNYTGRYTVVSIPPVVNGKRVVAIGREAFKGGPLSGSKYWKRSSSSIR